MFAKCLSVVLAISVLVLGLAISAPGQSSLAIQAYNEGSAEKGDRRMFVESVTKSKESEFAVKVKADIARVVTGPARLEIRLRDDSKFKDYIKDIGEENLIFVNQRTRAVNEPLYAQVTRVKRNNFNGKKVLLAAAIVAYFGTIAVLQFNVKRYRVGEKKTSSQ